MSRPLASKDSVELLGVRDTLKVVSFVRRNPGHGDGGPEEWNAGSALVYATSKDHDRDGIKESFILGKHQMAGDFVLGCYCGDYGRVLSDRRKVFISIRGELEETSTTNAESSTLMDRFDGSSFLLDAAKRRLVGSGGLLPILGQFY